MPGVPPPTEFIGYEIPPNQLTNCSAFSSGFGSIPAGQYPCGFQTFRNEDFTSSGSGEPYDIVVFGVDFFTQPNVHGGSYYYFSSTAFETPRQHETQLLGGLHDGTLVVSFSGVPEPASWAMMLLGFVFVGLAIRSAKRRQKLALAEA